MGQVVLFAIQISQNNCMMIDPKILRMSLLCLPCSIVLTMAFISLRRCLMASNLWPQTLGKLVLRHNRVALTTVPTNLDEMLAWASLEQDPVHHGIPVAMCLVYRKLLPNIEPIAVHLYGFFA